MIRVPIVRSAISSEKSNAVCLSLVLAVLLAATAMRWALSLVGSNLTFATYYPAVLICSLLTGWHYGAASAVLSSVIGSTLFPHDPLASTFDGAAVVNIVAFLGCCAIIIATADALRRAVRELDEANGLAAALNKELQHRVTNMLAVVQALASQSAKTANPGGFDAAFAGRLRALAKANALLGRRSLETCALLDLINEACEPFCDGDNITKHGPACLLPSTSCVPLVLALHELCTNAVKYGALSVPEGRVEVSWDLVDKSGRLSILWQEVGGPTVRQPTRKGIGSSLLCAQPGIAEVELKFDQTGLRCRLIVDGAEPI
jgi:two-component sensor histidine kinase